MRIKHLAIAAATALLMALGLPLTALAANVVVTSPNTQGWGVADSAAGGAVNYINDSTAPAGNGALQLTTTSDPSSKIQYMHAANTLLSSVTALSYYTKQNSASFAQGDPSYQLPVLLNGNSGFTTLVYEPYWNGTVTPGAWQNWDVSGGLFWSSHTITCSNGTVVGNAGGPATYTLAAIKTLCPNAVVTGYGLGVGSSNPSYNVESDQFNFNGTIYNFEPLTQPPTTRADCMNNGWQSYNNPPFANQGQCISYVNAHSHRANGGIMYDAFGLQRYASFNVDTASDSGYFNYADANNGWYTVDVSTVKIVGNQAWFAGRVTHASDPSWVGQWLFAKVEHNPDRIWGDFTSEAAAKAGVAAMTNPPSGPFNTQGHININ